MEGKLIVLFLPRVQYRDKLAYQTRLSLGYARDELATHESRHRTEIKVRVTYRKHVSPAMTSFWFTLSTVKEIL